MADENQGPEAELAKLAAVLDRDGQVDVEAEGAAETQPVKTEQPESQTGTEDEIAKEKAEADKAAAEQGKEAGKSDTGEEDSEYVKAQKDKDRLDRNWKKQQEIAEQNRRDREQLEREREDLRRERESKQQQQAPKLPDSDRDEEGFTAEQYEKYAEEFLAEGNREYAATARQKAVALRVATIQRKWQENIDAMVKEEPALAERENPVVKAAQKILEEIPVLRTTPEGARHAVRIAKAESTSSIVSGLQAENQKLKTEVDRLTKAMSVSGSGPTRTASEKAFDDLPINDQERELMKLAEEADRLGIG